MTTARVQTFPATTWDDARDLPFFRITGPLFTPDFCLGASVLLASYDDSDLDDVVGTSAPAARHHWDGTRTNPGSHSQPQHDGVPVQVRRAR